VQVAVTCLAITDRALCGIDALLGETSERVSVSE
jgi:hypothetical protein